MPSSTAPRGPALRFRYAKRPLGAVAGRALQLHRGTAAAGGGKRPFQVTVNCLIVLFQLPSLPSQFSSGEQAAGESPAPAAPPRSEAATPRASGWAEGRARSCRYPPRPQVSPYGGPARAPSALCWLEAAADPSDPARARARVTKGRVPFKHLPHPLPRDIRQGWGLLGICHFRFFRSGGDQRVKRDVSVGVPVSPHRGRRHFFSLTSIADCRFLGNRRRARGLEIAPG